jgi:hypothetical protein
MGHGRNVYMDLGRAGQSHELGMEGFHVLKLDSEKCAAQAQRRKTTFEPPLYFTDFSSRRLIHSLPPTKFCNVAGLLASHVLEHGLRLRLTGIIASLTFSVCAGAHLRFIVTPGPRVQTRGSPLISSAVFLDTRPG